MVFEVHENVLYILGCGEQLSKTILARECAESLKKQNDPTTALYDCFKKKFLGWSSNVDLSYITCSMLDRFSRLIRASILEPVILADH